MSGTKKSLAIPNVEKGKGEMNLYEGLTIEGTSS